MKASFNSDPVYFKSLPEDKTILPYLEYFSLLPKLKREILLPPRSSYRNPAQSLFGTMETGYRKLIYWLLNL